MREKYPVQQAYADYATEIKCKANEALDYYNALCNHFKGKLDAIYEDTIIAIIGKRGLSLLREFNLIESCGFIDGRKLYAL